MTSRNFVYSPTQYFNEQGVGQYWKEYDCEKIEIIERPFGHHSKKILYKKQLDNTTKILKLTYFTSEPNNAKRKKIQIFLELEDELYDS